MALGFHVGGNANFSIHVGGNANFSVFRYQHHHVGIPNAKFHVGGLSQREDASVFASQWNIGLCILPILNY